MFFIFSQAHNSFFGKSDLSFLCMLHPLSFDIKRQELEIEAVQVHSSSSYLYDHFGPKHEPDNAC